MWGIVDFGVIAYQHYSPVLFIKLKFSKHTCMQIFGPPRHKQQKYSTSKKDVIWNLIIVSAIKVK